MDIEALKTFCRAVELGNLTQAANSLHITKSVASRRLRALEEDLGVHLLSRTTRGVNPTEDGSRLYERGVRILEDLEDTVQSMRQTGTTLRGRLRMTAPRAFADIVLADMLTDFAAQHPELELDCNLSDERVDILGGGYDVALRIATTLDDTSLIAKKLAPVNNLLVAAPSYIEQHGRPELPDDLGNHQAIYYSHLNAAQQWVFNCAGRYQSVRIKGGLSTNSGIVQRAWAVGGHGIVILPRFFIYEQLADGSLVELMADSPPKQSHLYALYPERRHRPMKTRAMIAAVETCLGSLTDKAIL